VEPAESTNSDESMMRNVRELAYAGRYDDAAAILDLLDPSDGWVLTYRGFLARKAGNFDLARAYYDRALDRDPDNLLARSYLGQGYVTAGDTAAARRQYDQIIARGGAGTWPALSLWTALETGATSGY
jgi:tetratricopeptide (TPR) repeat protein